MELTVLNWSRDWSKFDFDAEYERVKAGHQTIFSEETFVEYVRWLRVYRPDLYLGWIIAELQGE